MKTDQLNHGEIDPNISVPDEVKRVANAADEAFYKAYPDKRPAAKPNPNAHMDDNEGPVTPEVTAEPPPPPEPETPKVETKPEPEPVTSKSNPEPEAPIDWENRYNSIKGRYDRLRSQYQSLEGVVATLQAANVPKPRDPAERLITPQEEADYGDELLSVVAKRAREELAPDLERLQTLVQMNAERDAEAARGRMLGRMDNLLPNWKVVNNQPEFLEWLALPDVMSGVNRMELLKAAYDRNDGDRVLAFFKGFLAEEAAIAPQPQPSPAPVSQKVPLEQFAAPGRAKTAAPQAPAEKPFISAADIAKFYADSTAGRFKGREAERDQLEEMIFDAQREGRIR